jgi:hypothetical protein
MDSGKEIFMVAIVNGLPANGYYNTLCQGLPIAHGNAIIVAMAK